MLKRYIIYQPEINEYYTGIKKYSWSNNILKSKAFKVKPTIKFLSSLNTGYYYLEIKTIYIPKD